MIHRVVLVAMLLAVAAGGSCKRTFKNLDTCRARGFEISDCEVGDGDPPPKMKKRCTKMLRRAKKCGGYQCESTGNGDGWNEVKWPDRNTPSGIDEKRSEYWEVKGDPVAVNVPAGENVVFTVRMNPVPGQADNDVDFYLIQRVESLDGEGNVLGTAEFLYSLISVKGIRYSRIYLITDDWGCYIHADNENMEDVMNLTDLTGYTVSMDVLGSYTAKGGGGVDTAYSFAGNPDKGCYMEKVLGAKQARVYFLTKKREGQFIWDNIKIEWKAELISP